MKVSELIEKLQQYPQDKDVAVICHTEDYPVEMYVTGAVLSTHGNFVVLQAEE